jgi:plasmid stabilization system protein ParE
MELTVFWTEFATNKLADIFEYYQQKSKSVKVARKLVETIIDRTIGLEKHPFTGQIEELLVDRQQEFRYLVVENYKIIYWINPSKNRIEVVHVFDTRQNPLRLRETKLA